MKRKQVQDAPHGLRIPIELKGWLKVRAQESRRSFNGMCVHALEEYRAQAQKRETQHG